MKRLSHTVIGCVGLLFVFNTTSSLGQGHAISANPIGLAFGILNATYEHKVGTSNSFTVSGYRFSFATNWSAYGIGGSYRWYFNLDDGKKPIQGLSAGPLIAFGFWSWDGPDIYDPWGILDSYDGGTSVAIGGELAYKWVFSGFVVEPILALTFNAVDITGLSYQAYGVGVNLGYSW